MKNNFYISDILEASKNERSALIQIEKTEELFSPFNSDRRTDFIRSLDNVSPSASRSNFQSLWADESGTLNQVKTLGSDTVTFRGWKNVANISARLIEYYDDVVVLECLTDKELGVYEEREFRVSMFDGYELKIGNLFYLRYFDGKNETKLEIHDDPKLTSAGDFPKKDFTNLFKESKLFKK